MIRLGILGSTRGTNMLAIINAIEQGELNASIEIVISNKQDAMILERAKANGIPAEFISSNGLKRSQYDELINQELLKFEVDLVVLIGYMRILSEQFVNHWKNRIINVHPSLLPAFAGKMDEEVHRSVLEAGEKQTGCTIHFVTEQVDAGPIILQKVCSVSNNDTIESLKSRVQKLESVALIEAIEILASN